MSKDYKLIDAREAFTKSAENEERREARRTKERDDDCVRKLNEAIANGEHKVWCAGTISQSLVGYLSAKGYNPRYEPEYVPPHEPGASYADEAMYGRDAYYEIFIRPFNKQ